MNGRSRYLSVNHNLQFSMKHLTFVALLLLGCQTLGFSQNYSITVEGTPAVTAGLTTYRFYVDLNDPTDRVSAVYGNNQASLLVDAPEGVYNTPLNASWNASGINPAFLVAFPEMADDTYATIGLDGPAATSGIVGAADPSIVEDEDQQITPFFLTPGATNLVSTTLTGSSWYVLNTAANGLPDENLQVLIMQVTTSGMISGQINAQVFPLSVGADQYQGTADFDGEGTFELVCTNCPGSAGCTDSGACNYDADATEDDGTCEFTSCAGCTDATACNYAPAATLDDSSCTYAEANQDCDGNCLVAVDCNGECGGTAVVDECGVCGGGGIPAGDCDCDGNVADAIGVCGGDCAEDVNGDNICDDEQTSGCTSPAACNYDPAAVVDDGSCDFLSCIVFGCDDPSACNFDDTVEINDGSCDYLSCIGCQNPAACNYDEDALIPGTCDFDSCAGCTNPEADNYDPTATIDNGSCVIPGCTIPQACNYNADATENDGSCEFLSCAGVGCTDPSACNYDEDAVILDDTCIFPGFLCDDGDDMTINDVVSDECNCEGDPIVNGCTDNMACNYDPSANVDDGTCAAVDECGVCGGTGVDSDMDGICDDIDDCVGAYDACGVCNGDDSSCTGCADSNACNYEGATIDDGSCLYLDECGVCGGTGVDSDMDGICDDIDDCVGAYDACGVCNGDDSTCTGCADSTACNYEGATIDDGSCIFPGDACDDGDAMTVNDVIGDDCVCAGEAIVDGCTNPDACNYDPAATVDDGSCLTLDCNGECGGTAELDACGICGGDGTSCAGCTDSEACNYDATATIDDGSCTYPAEDYLDCDGNCLNDADGDGVCDELEVAGCTNSDACNYDELATDDDASCILIGDACDDGDENTINDVIGADCECNGETDGIEEASMLTFGMFPNPTTGEVTLTLSGFHSGVTIQVLDGAGRVVWTRENVAMQGNTVLDLSALSSGSYNVMLSDERGVSVQRLAIQR